MKKRIQVLITFIFIIILITGLYIFTDWFSKVTGYFTGEDEKTNLAQCLKEKGVEFYTNNYCAECEKQIKIFGKAEKYINKIDCGRNQEKCPNIKKIPAWYLNKTIVYGYKNLTQLDELSGCKTINQ